MLRFVAATPFQYSWWTRPRLLFHVVHSAQFLVLVWVVASLVLLDWREDGLIAVSTAKMLAFARAMSRGTADFEILPAREGVAGDAALPRSRGRCSLHCYKSIKESPQCPLIDS